MIIDYFDGTVYETKEEAEKKFREDWKKTPLNEVVYNYDYIIGLGDLISWIQEKGLEDELRKDFAEALKDAEDNDFNDWIEYETEEMTPEEYEDWKKAEGI